MERYAVVLDDGVVGKPRACTFAGDAIDGGAAAAHLHGLSVVVPATDELVTVAREISSGRVSSAGKVVCASVKQEVYDKFAALIGTEHQLKPGDQSSVGKSGATSAPATPDLWSTIDVGSVVLATVGREDGWWEAVVLAADPSSDRLTLSWRDWPKMPSFGASRRSVAVTSPKA
ncbi:hypothetical protein [Mesorhizobium sp. LNJC394B00]|uniref:hypothetical protein n=1 Tax=unclassified Mesorhizobium TaxID=325217 RepID=UPI0003CE30B0|nr:hypothetical protein [Mesorhizobium sp. LNJC394B00]ESY23265.1 hypothetical protein X750_09375 [Mesorhizobium sp. LNJC394B00]